MLSQRAGTSSLFSNSVFIFLIRFFPSLAAVLVMIWYSRKLTPASYGAYQNFWIQLNLLSAVGCMGLQAFLLTYTPEFMIQLLRKTARSFYLAFSFWIVLIAVVFSFLQARSSGLPVYITLPFLLVFSVSAIAEAFLTLFRKFRFLFWVNLSYTAFFCLIHWTMAAGSFELVTLFELLLVLACIKAGCFVTASLLRLRTEPLSESTSIDRKSVRSLWLHLGLYDISQMLFRWLDKFIISIVLSTELSAIYFNGSNDIPFLSLLLGAVGSASLIHLSSAKDLDDARVSMRVTNQSSRILSSIVFPVLFFFVFFRYEVFLVIFSPKYLPSVPVFLCSLGIIPFRAYNWTAILQNRHKGAIINKGAALDLILALTFIYPFYRWMGLPGVALAFVVPGYFQGWYYLHHISAILNTSISRILPVANWALKLAVFASVFFSFHYLIEDRYPKWVVLLAGIALLLVTVVTTLWIELGRARHAA